ncbi:MAG: hypothetical protein BMS9Abin29_1168 [Gemmatimonadota bacterium]|nr:MAG: hypothetical protein BMS9Abin29_1168 [Gemmatimonadota bacterium]
MWKTNLKVLAVVLGTLAVFTIVSSSIPQLQSVVPEDLSFSGEVTAEELVAAGRALFEGAGGCADCHGLGTRAPNLLTDEAGTGQIGVRCASRVTGQDCKAYLFNSLVDPNAFQVDGYIPIMADMSRTLSNEQIWALVAYLQSQGGEVTVTGADVESDDDGESTGVAVPAATATAGPTSASTDPVEIMTANACLGCHIMDGVGPPLGPSFDGIGSRVSADYIRESILDPRSGAAEGYEAMIQLMPPTFGEQLSAAQLEAIVQFLAARR